MAITQKTVVRMTVRADCPTHARTSARAGKHELVIDEPAAGGGTDEGPTPIETMIAALLGCTNVIFNRVAEKNHVEVRELSLAAEDQLRPPRRDVRGRSRGPVSRDPADNQPDDAGERVAVGPRQIGARQVLPGLEGHPPIGNEA